MRIYVAILICFSIPLGCKKGSDPKQSQDAKGNTLFVLLDSLRTGIDFMNNVADGEKFNILTYRNFYNGGGVAIGDINNDALPDVYFTANQGKNRLYINKGDFVFEDITEKAGVGGIKPWSTGVTMADVNGDGLLDIYVCNSGDVDGAYKENELFINNGNLTFSERAKEFNLNNSGYSTHAAFFDYDLDGDLDCYILNNSFKDPGKIELYKNARAIPDEEGGDKLMRNDGNTFTDVSQKAGIYSSEIGFGLGVAISDLNQDQWPDIYVSNDFWERDYLYLNKGDGTFSEELIDRISYCSTSSMGADIADLNNDGHPEIFTTDMLPGDNLRLKTTIAFDPYHLEDIKYRANYHYQMTQNCLHLNDGRANFQETAFYAGVAATDWSWGALIFDFENDGNKDIFVSNGIAKEIMSLDFRDFLSDTEKRKEIIAKKGKFDYRDFISYMPATPLRNYAFGNEGKLLFQDKAEGYGLGQPSFSNGSAYGDLDNDGDMDLVVNNVNAPCFVYRNEASKTQGHHYLKLKFKGYAKNPFGIGAKVVIKSNGEIKVLENFNTRGFESSIEPSLLFGLGKINTVDELTVFWPDKKEQTLKGIKVDQTLLLEHANARISHDDLISEEKPSLPLFEEVSGRTLPHNATHKENPYNDFDHEVLLFKMLSTEGPRFLVGDVNGDQLDDFVLLGAAGDADKLFVQKKDGTFGYRPMPSFLNDAAYEGTCGDFLDVDGDGDLDMMIGSGGNEYQKDKKLFKVRLYKNDGQGNFSPDVRNVPNVVGNFSTLKADDFDGDGAVDVFIGARAVPGNYGLPPQSYLLKNDKGNWMNVAAPYLGNMGMVTDATWTDVDHDGDNDLVIVGDWMGIQVFKNESGLLEAPVVVPHSKGWWNRIEAHDLDKDGDMDFVLGNWGLNSKFKATTARPLTMDVNDFDQNGKSEFIINWYPPLDQQSYPFAPKPELTLQMPSLRKTILRYGDYARKTYDSLFMPEVRNNAIHYEANTLESAVLWNHGNAPYVLEALPVEAQLFPVFGIIAQDFDGDGYIDLWLGGNFYGLKPQVGRQDASKGLFLKGISGKRHSFQPIEGVGLQVKGEVRDAVMLNSKMLVARNNDKVLVFQRLGKKKK